jgi:hypothetical protein
MTNPDYRALCKELINHLQVRVSNEDREIPTVEYYSQSQQLLDRARAALAEQPVPEGPTDEALVQLAFREKLGRLDSNGNIITRYYYPLDIRENVIAFARAVLAKWGQP